MAARTWPPAVVLALLWLLCVPCLVRGITVVDLDGDRPVLTAEEQLLVGLTNEVRTAANVLPVQPHPALQAFARARAQELIGLGRQEHGDAMTQLRPYGLAVPGLDVLCRSWDTEGGALQECFWALVASPPHAAHLFSAEYGHVGAAMASDGTVSQVVVVFAQISMESPAYDG